METPYPKSREKGQKKACTTKKTYWGANERTLRTVYEGSIRPRLEYRSAAWSTTAKTNLQTMDKLQNQALRLITGTLRSTPIHAMEKATGIQPDTTPTGSIESKDLYPG